MTNRVDNMESAMSKIMGKVDTVLAKLDSIEMRKPRRHTTIRSKIFDSLMEQPERNDF